MARYVPLGCLLAVYAPGDFDTWKQQIADLEEHHAERLATLAEQILADGITTPILLGTDGRIWDGHHRITVAYRRGIEFVPVNFIEDERAG